MKIAYSIWITLLGFALIGGTNPHPVFAHCQVPCGIYDDHARVVALLEDAATIEKAIMQMDDLAGKKDAQSGNQFARWVVTKEQHSQRIISTISDYFLTQRVKGEQKDYVERLKRHHAVIVAAMKAKQSADKGAALGLTRSIQALKEYYPQK